jgi:hypothetical protein
MNLPSFTRAAFATGIFSLAFVLSGYALTPPFLKIKTANLKVGPVASGAAANLNNHVYYAGGILPGGTVSNAITDVDTFHHTVTALAPMPTARAGLGIAPLFSGTAPGGNVLYAIGGTSGTGVLGANEMFNPETGTWTVLAPLPTPRAYLTVVGGTDGLVYAIGGVDSTGKSVNTVEIYNPTLGSWSTGPSLLTARSHAAADLIYNDIIMVAGGQDVNGTVLNTTEDYFLSLKAWVAGASMTAPRADFGLALGGDGYVHAFGGRSTTSSLRTIEAFKLSTNSWILEPEKLPVALSGVTATETLAGAIFTIGGKEGARLQRNVTRAFPPWQPTHSVTFFVHGYDEPFVNGSFAMNSIPPLQGFGLLSIGVGFNNSFTTYPDVGGVIASGGTMTISIPATILLGVINGLTVTAENQDGTDPVVIGTTGILLGGLSGNVSIPINTPLTLHNKLLVVTITSLLGLDLNFSSGFMTMTLTGLEGKPSDPQ